MLLLPLLLLVSPPSLHAPPPSSVTCRCRSVILERALKRLEWERVQEKEAKAKAAREDAEREAMMSVDWHEFAVVETIEFYDDEVDDLPAPMTLKDVSGVGGGGGGGG